jgi:DNA polymerase III delta prime subunit
VTEANHLLRYGWFETGDTYRFMRQSFFGFKPVYEHLQNTRRYLQRPDNIATARWRAVPEDELTHGDRPAAGFWVQLLEPPDDDEQGAQLFRLFFDDYTRSVFDPDGAVTGGAVRFDRRDRIEVLAQIEDEHRLLLDREPTGEQLLIRPNTYTIDKQLAALRSLQERPRREHLPLLQLVQPVDANAWPDLDLPTAPRDWHILTDDDRPGVTQQRLFVEKALATPDLAILEGPPGSGKTTTICELISQLVGEGKRVLVCASTHVAVDNVLERLDAPDNPTRDDIVAVRIGNRSKVSERLRHLQIEERVSTERQKLLEHLRSISDPTLAQERLLRVVEDESQDRVEQLVLSAANVVCGTTIGILGHPDIRRADREGSQQRPYDVLILDEASKTTLHEFLVPAVLANRWILSGDVRQLSPQVDSDEIAASLQPACAPHPEVAAAGLDTLQLGQRGRTLALLDQDVRWTDTYVAKADELGLPVTTYDGTGDLPTGLVLCTGSAWQAVLRSTEDGLVRRNPRLNADDTAAWSREVAWRLATRFQLRLTDERDQAFRDDLQRLLPPQLSRGYDQLTASIDRVQRLALPSILESLQQGFGEPDDRNPRTTLTEGLPPAALDQRHERLRYQFRMHPEISELPRAAFYDGDALQDPPDMAANREWSYRRYPSRATWLDVPVAGPPDRRAPKRSEREAELVIEEIVRLHEWAESSTEGRAWSVAVICFYREQEREVRRHLRRLTGRRSAYRYFPLEGAVSTLKIDLCTVDGIQGQEADVTFLTVGVPYTTAFTRSVNRVNVAVTRARYQLVVVGDRKRLRNERRASPLRHLARTVPSDLTWEAGGGDR